jgi:hypothetical protein
MYKSIRVKLEGAAPIVLHNGQLADPLNEWSRELSKVSRKKNKTEDDHLAMSRIEWLGGLYTDDDGDVCIPGEMIEAMLKKGAQKNKMGKLAEAGVLVEGSPKLVYDGAVKADKLESLFGDKRFTLRVGVRVKQNRVMRTRPIFRRWSLPFEVQYLPDVVSTSDVRDSLEWSSKAIGLGNWRPKYGRFRVAEFKA